MPITLIVLALCVSITPVSVETLMLFLAGAALLILGMGFFHPGCGHGHDAHRRSPGREAHPLASAGADRSGAAGHRRDHHPCRARLGGAGQADARACRTGC